LLQILLLLLFLKFFPMDLNFFAEFPLGHPSYAYDEVPLFSMDLHFFRELLFMLELLLMELFWMELLFMLELLMQLLLMLLEFLLIKLFLMELLLLELLLVHGLLLLKRLLLEILCSPFQQLECFSYHSRMFQLCQKDLMVGRFKMPHGELIQLQSIIVIDSSQILLPCNMLRQCSLHLKFLPIDLPFTPLFLVFSPDSS
jgi:hypothetical protein